MAESLPLRILPFDADSFDWNRFESFCLATARALPRVKRADRYGKNGEAQRGIDIEADLEDGRKLTIQCRLRKTITLPQTKKTVRGTTYPADEHEIWVTCPVSAKVSDYIDGLPDWTIETDEGISQVVRIDVPRERARLIVRDAFGAQTSRDFLGLDPAGFYAPKDHFRAPPIQPRLLRQDLPLVGRAEELSKVASAIVDEKVPVVVVSGRGGIGKTRFLRAAAESLESAGKKVLIAADPALLTAETVDNLPLGEVVVIVDDVHRQDVDMSPLLGAILRRKDPLHLILGTRPSGIEGIRTATAQANLEGQDLALLPRLEPLELSEVRSLSELALGERSQRSDRLAEATADLPMMTVLGGTLIARGDFDDDPEAGSQALREEVMRRFLQEQRGLISDRIPAEKAKLLLELLSALNPIDTSDTVLLELVSGELDCRPSEVKAWTSEIEDAGLLLRRGTRRRLTPDILADQILFESCLDRQGTPTGRANELWNRYGHRCPGALLANLGELDWRTTHRGEPVLNGIWDQLLTEFELANAAGREQILETIEPAAYFWPAQILQVVDVALSHPAVPMELEVIGMRIDDDSVREKLPALLGRVGQHPAHVLDALQRLWTIGKHDMRDTNPFPEHPRRVMAELAGYEHGPEHQNALLDLIDEELARSQAEQGPISPLTLAEVLLATEGSHTSFDGQSFQTRPYFFDPAAVRGFRDRVRELLLNQSLLGYPRERALAARMVGTALQSPYGLFGNPVSKDLRARWVGDQKATLETAETIAAATTDGPVRIELKKAVRQFGTTSSSSSISRRAERLVDRLTVPEDEILEAIALPWDLHDLSELEERNRQASSKLLRLHSSGEAIAEFVEGVLDEIARFEISEYPNPGAVLFHAFELSPEIAEQFWAFASDQAELKVAPSCEMALSSLRRNAQNVDDKIIEVAESSDVRTRSLAAAYLQSGSWFDDPTSAELDLIKKLSEDEDGRIRETISIALMRLQKSHPQTAISIALATVLRPEDTRTADHLFATVNDFGLANLTSSDMSKLMDQLVGVIDLEYSGNVLLSQLRTLDLSLAVEVWSRRLLRSTSRDYGSAYRAVPFHDFTDTEADIASTDQGVDDFMALLSILHGLRSWDRRQLGEVYWRLALPGINDETFSEDFMERHRTWVDSATAAFATCARENKQHENHFSDALMEMPWQLLLDRASWVSQLLDEAQDPEVLASGLRDSAMGGVTGRGIGEDNPRWTTTLARSNALKDSLPLESAGRGFYSDLERFSASRIANDRSDDEEDRRGWH